MTEKRSIARDRRAFLKGVAVAGGATALTLASRNVISASPETPSEAKDSASNGYRKTSHVKAFYASARI